ncbi:MAG: hypothetical protein PHU68_02565 [Paludibacter sp.]|nr:hypothetical protein [Paludibacter sp.]
MKKTVLILSLFIAGASVLTVQAQKEWTFDKAPFEATTYSQTTTLDGLTVYATEGKTVVIDENNKRNGEYAFTHRLKFGGSGTIADSENAPFLPSERAISFPVTGPTTVKIAALSSSSSTDRTLVMSDGITSLHTFAAPGSYSEGTDNVPLETYQYTGGAGTLYIWSPSSGVNLYMVATSTTTGISKVTIDGVSFNGREIVNENQVRLEVYNILGNKVAESTSNISMVEQGRGIYFVKAANSKVVLKINR